MAQLNIELAEKSYRPQEIVRGTASWDTDQAPSSIEVRLFWFTRGKGSVNASIVATARFDHPLPRDRQPFELRLPEQPFTFSGTLISLIWAVELVAEPQKESTLKEIVMSPNGNEILLPRIETAADRMREKIEQRFRNWHREGAR